MCVCVCLWYTKYNTIFVLNVYYEYYRYINNINMKTIVFTYKYNVFIHWCFDEYSYTGEFNSHPKYIINVP